MTATMFTVCVERGLRYEGTGLVYETGARGYRLTLDLEGLCKLDAQLRTVRTARYWVEERNTVAA